MSYSSPRPSVSSQELTGSAKLEDVTRLMTLLSLDLQDVNLLPHQRDAHLEQVKVYGRDPKNSDPIFTKEGIETLTRHAFNSPSSTTSRNALRCLANAMLLKENTRQIFLDLGYEAKACAKLKNDSRDDEFLVSRIIFLTTYGTTLDIEKLINEYQLADNICQNLSRHAEQYSNKPKKSNQMDPMEDMALIETLKLMFNLTHFCPQRVGSFSPSLQPLLTILSKRPMASSKPLEPPFGPLINALMNLDLENKDNIQIIFPKGTPNINTERLIEILEKATKVYADDELEHQVSPLLTLLRKLYDLAPDPAKSSIESALLPSDSDRTQPLGRSESLPSRLLRLSTNPATPQVYASISALLFELSGKDAQRFVHNVGYGFASGFLFQHNIAIPENALEAWSTSDSEQERPSIDSAGPVNPITGQTLASEPVVELPEMTEAEKEREAERLFVLFDRLKKTGVMNVVNPVEKAFQEGRFQELDDDADSE